MVNVADEHLYGKYIFLLCGERLLSTEKFVFVRRATKTPNRNPWS